MFDFFQKINWFKIFLVLLPTLVFSLFIFVLNMSGSIYIKSEKPLEPRNNPTIVFYNSINCDCKELTKEWNSFKEANKDSGITFKEISYSDLKYDDFFKVYGVNGTQQFVVFNSKGEVVGATTQNLSIEAMNTFLFDSLSNEPHYQKNSSTEGDATPNEELSEESVD